MKENSKIDEEKIAERIAKKVGDNISQQLRENLNKEYMEEKKLNLKPLDYELAKKGKPVCTRDGRKARIICFDRKYLYEGHDYSMVVLIDEGGYNETVCSYTKEGLYEPGKYHNNDLMMLPEEKEGWVNIYRDNEGKIFVSRNTYKTREEAFDRRTRYQYIDTVKITWEE